MRALVAILTGLAATSNAWAAPDAVVQVWPAGSGEVRGLRATASGRVVAGVASRNLVLLDTWRWIAPEDLDSPCTVTAVGVADQADGDVRVGIGCDDGTIRLRVWDGTSLGPWRGGEADIADDDAGAVRAVTFDEDLALYAIVEANTGGTGARTVRFTVQGDGYVVDRAYGANGLGILPGGFVDTVEQVVQGAVQVVVAHSSTRVSTWNPLAGTVASAIGAMGGVDVTDLAPRSAGGAWVADARNGQLATFLGATQAALFNVAQSGLVDPTSLVEFVDGGTLRFLIADGSDVIVQDALPGAELDRFQVAPANDLVDLVVGLDGWIVGGSSTGQLAVLTDAPWLSSLTLTPEEVTEGTPVEVAFTTDMPGRWTIRRGGGLGRDGVELASGTASAAGEVRASFTVDAGFGEGGEIVWAFLDAGDGARFGHIAGTVTLDNPPGRVELRPSDVSFGNGALRVQVRPLSAADIEGYDLYLSTTEFSAADYPAGGPTGQVGDTISPRTLSPPDDGAPFEVTLGGLANGQTYYIAIRARDASVEGPMSNVQSGTPQDTLFASQSAGDPGGCSGETTASSCSSAGGGWLVGLGGLLGVLATRRRRAGAAIGLAAALFAMPAHAQDSDSGTRRRPLAGLLGEDLTPAWVNVEIGYGSFGFDDDAIRTVYKDRAGIMRIETGLQLFRVAEIDLGIGLLQPTGNTLSADTGQPSGEQVRMVWMPLTMALTGRLHLLDEQPIVPYARVGLDYVFWKEAPLDADGKVVAADRVAGSKRGWHWGVGGNILLDLFAPRRASMLEASSGINDTWLYVEYRRQLVNNGGPGLDFSGWSIGAGLKIDY